MLSSNFGSGKENRKIVNCSYRNKTFSFEENITIERIIKKRTRTQKINKYAIK